MEFKQVQRATKKNGNHVTKSPGAFQLRFLNDKKYNKMKTNCIFFGHAGGGLLGLILAENFFCHYR